MQFNCSIVYMFYNINKLSDQVRESKIIYLNLRI